MAGDIVTAAAAGAGVTQAADGQPEQEKPAVPAEQVGVTAEDAADGTAPGGAARRRARPRAAHHGAAQPDDDRDGAAQPAADQLDTSRPGAGRARVRASRVRASRMRASRMLPSMQRASLE